MAIAGAKPPIAIASALAIKAISIFFLSGQKRLDDEKGFFNVGVPPKLLI